PETIYLKARMELAALRDAKTRDERVRLLAQAVDYVESAVCAGLADWRGVDEDFRSLSQDGRYNWDLLGGFYRLTEEMLPPEECFRRAVRQGRDTSPNVVFPHDKIMGLYDKVLVQEPDHVAALTLRGYGYASWRNIESNRSFSRALDLLRRALALM